jgi:hypothetical protein
MFGNAYKGTLVEKAQLLNMNAATCMFLSVVITFHTVAELKETGLPVLVRQIPDGRQAYPCKKEYSIYLSHHSIVTAP